ncbi:MAG: hypothetical protein Q9212_001790 [Teloschistes hypoglaucus]
MPALPGSEEVGTKGTQSPSETALSGAPPPAPSENQSSSEDRRSPFSSDSFDEESPATGVSRPPKAFGDRFKSLFKLRIRPSSDFTGDAERDQLIKSLDQYAAGYPKVAAYENLDPNFLIYRKFGWLHNRVLLYLQDELAELEYRLEKLDKRTLAEENGVQLMSRRLDYVDCPLRKRLVQLITERLEVYEDPSDPKTNDPKPKIRLQLHPNTDSLVHEEYEWIKSGVDLAALAHDREAGRFAAFLKDMMDTISEKATLVSLCNEISHSSTSQMTTDPQKKAIFRTKEQKIITGHENVSLISPHRLDILTRTIQTIFATILLLVPVGILFELQPTTHHQDVRKNSRYQILTIFISTLVFSAACAVFTKAGRGEVFTATAAYCAVLVVVLGGYGGCVLI